MNLPLPSNRTQAVLHLLLADDDIDDCFLFKEALDELKIPVDLTVVHNGEQLMQLLNKSPVLPDLLFLDVNMSRKNGFACLCEIKDSQKLKGLPVIMLSTSFNADTITLFRQHGAWQCIRKPNNFSQLKEEISRCTQAFLQAGVSPAPAENSCR